MWKNFGRSDVRFCKNPIKRAKMFFLRDFCFRCVYYKITFQKIEKWPQLWKKKQLRKKQIREKVSWEREETHWNRKHKMNWNDLGIIWENRKKAAIRSRNTAGMWESFWCLRVKNGIKTQLYRLRNICKPIIKHPAPIRCWHLWTATFILSEDRNTVSARSGCRSGFSAMRDGKWRAAITRS